MMSVKEPKRQWKMNAYVHIYGVFDFYKILTDMHMKINYNGLRHYRQYLNLYPSIHS